MFWFLAIIQHKSERMIRIREKMILFNQHLTILVQICIKVENYMRIIVFFKPPQLAVPLGGSVPAIVGGSHFVAFLVSFRGTTDHTQLEWIILSTVWLNTQTNGFWSCLLDVTEASMNSVHEHCVTITTNRHQLTWFNPSVGKIFGNKYYWNILIWSQSKL